MALPLTLRESIELAMRGALQLSLLLIVLALPSLLLIALAQQGILPPGRKEE